MNVKPTISQPGDSLEIEKCYQNAQVFMQGCDSKSLIQNDNIQPQWINSSDCFWYQRYYKIKGGRPGSIGNEYRIVDANKRINRLAFDHSELAKALATATEQNINQEDLPFSDVTFSLTPLTVSFIAYEQHWKFEAESQTCVASKLDTPQLELPCESLSPDGTLIAFVREYNLWVREVSSGDERPLTSDGEAFYRYAGKPTAVGFTDDDEILSCLNLCWSPNSKRLFTVQRDSRKVLTHPVVNHAPKNGSIRPTVDHIKVAFAGDEHFEEYRLLSIDIQTAHCCEVKYPRLTVGQEDNGFCSVSGRAWWAGDSKHAYFIDYQGDYRKLSVIEVDTNTGTTRKIFEEKASTNVNIQPSDMDSSLYRYLSDSNELIWWSERSGWGHLYLYDLNTGQCKNQITQGDWLVRNILHIDADKRELLIQTAGRVEGRNPYYRDICRVNIDSGEFNIVLSTDDEYAVHIHARNSVENNREMAAMPGAEVTISGVSPKADFIVATRSRIDQLPVSLLLNREGEVLMELEAANITSLPKGWHWPESVKLKAAEPEADGTIYDIYSTLFRPSNFREDKKYPLINMIVGGAWLSPIPIGSFHHTNGYTNRNFFWAQAIAELGFMVVITANRGTPLRGKAFQDISYGWLADGANTADQRSAIEQLAKRYPSIDLNRVGVFAPTGYPGALENLFECPDLYRTGVVGLFIDSRLMSPVAEHVNKYQGFDAVEKNRKFPEELIENWEGKLLLVKDLSGMLAQVYPSAAMYRLVEAFERANKDVDLLVSSTRPDWSMPSYQIRRIWDYFVTYLQDGKPPKAFKLSEYNT